ncbi:MAG: 5-deoxy-glucuronate isomerase [Chloroflexota bacterium]|nr:5-deoxy-glucuronate isomerase [Chloroflexota bacterium]
MQLKFQYTPTLGMTEIVSPATSVLKWISARAIRLNNGESYSGNTGDEEQAFVVMTGAYIMEIPDKPSLENPGRRDVFEKRAAIAYLPPNTPYTIMAIGGMPLEVAIGGARGSHEYGAQPVLLLSEDLKYEVRGAWNWERHIYNAITSVNPVSERLFLIEVYTPPGNWSSVPPHKHDTDNLPYESSAEEIYFFKLKPEQGFGFQRIYTADRTLDQVELAENNSAIIQPQGYHPVANHPGYEMYYLNIIAGEKRALVPSDDPAHQWLKNVEAVVKARS